MSDEQVETIRLAAGDAEATLSLGGAEPLSWRVGGRELLWHGDPAHWGFRAPILFPVVGASAGGVVRVDGATYPMAQHGFARTAPFALVAEAGNAATLRLEESDETLARYPFRFRLDVTASLDSDALSLAFAVTNTGDVAMPYGLGFHPAFPWPFIGSGREGHRVRFEAAETPEVPEVAAGGLLARRVRSIPLAGRDLPLSSELFTEALVFLDAKSRSFAFEAPGGAAIEMKLESFPHLAVWTKPTAPFLSLEAWTAHADWEGADGELAARSSMTLLAPGMTGRHAVTMRWRAPAG